MAGKLCVGRGGIPWLTKSRCLTTTLCREAKAFVHSAADLLRKSLTNTDTMNVSSRTLDIQGTQTPSFQQLSLYHVFAGVLFFLLSFLTWHSLSPRTPDATQLPLVNKRKFWEFSDLRVKTEFYFNGRQTLEKALQRLPGKPFQMTGDTGRVIILPPEFANEIRNSPHLDFSKVVARVCHISCTTL